MEKKRGFARITGCCAILLAVFLAVGVMPVSRMQQTYADEGERGTNRAYRNDILRVKITNIRVSGESARIVWNGIKGEVKEYQILRSAKKNGKYKMLAKTKKTVYKDRNLGKARTWFYQICAVTKADGKTHKSRSAVKRITTEGAKTFLKSKGSTSSSCFLRWRSREGAVFYEVYRKTADTDYVLVKKVHDTSYEDRNLKEKTKYRYRVRVVGRNRQGYHFESGYSNGVTVYTQKRARRTAYVGDSVMSGLGEYKVVRAKNKKVIAKIGVSPYTFYNNAIMDNLLDYKPDHLFVMLGMNALGGNPSKAVINSILKYYKIILRECQKENPDIKIVILAVSPTRPSASVKNAVINRFNGYLADMAKKMNLRYYDYTAAFKDASQSLKSAYAEGDGIHWKISGYRKFKELLDNYEKTL